MPRAPQYSRQVTSITPPNARAQAPGDINSYGGGVARQLGQLGNMAVARADEMQAEDDRNQVIQAKTALDTQLTTTLYDENNGLLNQKGSNALDITNKFNQDYDNLVKTTAQTLKTKRQQDVFNQYSMGQKDNYLRSVSSHQARERQTYTEDNANAAITSAQNLAIVDPNNQAVFDNSIATIYKTIDSVYGYRGKEVTDAMKSKTLSGIRSEQVTSMISQNQGIAARDFLVAHKNEIDPKQYDNLFAGAESKAAVQESKAVADDVFSRYGVNDERAAMKYLKQAYGNNPGYDRFSSAVQARFVDERRFKNEEQKQNEEQVLVAIWKADSLSEALEIARGSGLPPSKQLYLENQAKSKFKSLAAKPTPDQTYWHNYERTGLTSDIENMRLYEKRTQEGGEPTPEQQKSANVSAARLNSYWQFSSGGAYNPNAKQKEVIPLDEYQLLKSKGFTDEQIASEYLTDGVEE